AVQRGGRLGDGRETGEFAAVPCAVPGDDDGVRGEVDVEGDVEGGVLCRRPRLAAGTADRRGRGGVDVGDERFAQRDVEMHRAGVARAGAAGGGEDAAHGGAPLAVGVAVVFGEAE